MATLFSMDVSTGDYNQPLISGERRESLVDLIYFLKRCLGGGNLAATTFTVRNTGVVASATVTAASTLANDTVTFGGVVFTAVNSGPAANQFVRDASNTITATNLAAAINASTTDGVSGVISATSSAAVVTVSCMVPGNVGNGITLSSSGATLAVSGTRLASGSESRFTISA